MSKVKSQYGKGVEICVSWVPASNGHVPARAVRAGDSCYVARGLHNGEYIPGKVCEGHGYCYMSYGGTEHAVSDCEVLVESGILGTSGVQWIHNSGNTIPEGAVIGGTDGGEPLYIARSQVDGNVVVGKYSPRHGCAYVPYGDLEHRRDNADVLCCVTKHG